MSRLEIELAYPLRWPEGRPRSTERRSALFKHEGRAMTLSAARKRLQVQLEMISTREKFWRTRDHVLSMNIRFTLAGTRDRNFLREPADCGVALYFRLDKRPLVLACDRWDTVQDNIAAIAAHIEALRGQERWGVADLAQAFAGHVALPAPEQWWQVLGVPATASIAEVDAAWRARIAAAHPDKHGGSNAAAHPDKHGGSNAAAARLNAARDEGRKIASTA